MNHVFKLLWRHIIAVELFHHVNTEQSQGWDGVLGWLQKMLHSDRKRAKLFQQAEEYVKKYGNTFWEPTETRVTAIVDGLKNRIEETIGAKIGVNGLSVTGNQDSGEEKIRILAQEVVTNFSSVIGQGQIGELKVLETVVEGLLHKRRGTKNVYITIDGLDEDWVDESVKYLLLRSLIDTARELNKQCDGIKIILALRLDLLDRLFSRTHETGQQREKYEDIFLYLGWTIEDLTELTNLRINKLVTDRYTGAAIGIEDILPPFTMTPRMVKRYKIKPLQYLWNQTWLRPRDVIVFINSCLDFASGQTMLSQEIVKRAEKKYSKSRYKSIIDEWEAVHPYIGNLLTFLKNIDAEFIISSLSQDKWSNLALDIIAGTSSTFTKIAHDFINDSNMANTYRDISLFEREVIMVLYEVGAIGIKTSPKTSTNWKYVDDHILVNEDIRRNCRVSIHQALWQELGIKSPFDPVR